MKSYKPKENLELYKWKETILELVSQLKNSKNTKSASLAKKALLSIIDQDDRTKTFAFKWMEQSSWFKHLPIQVALSGLVHAIEKNDGLAAKTIVRETQKNKPFHPELPAFKLENGEHIIHRIARADKDKVFSELSKLNPLWGSIKDQNGNTPLHIASKYISIKTLLCLGKRQPELLMLRNKKGLRPIDLESGPIILKHIPKDVIIESALKANKTKKESRAKLLKALNTSNSRKELGLLLQK